MRCLFIISDLILFLAYLIKYKGLNVRQAYNLVVKARGVARPNSAFLKDLVKFEKECLGTESTKIIRMKRGNITVEVPDFLKTDFPDKYEEEFSNNRRMNRVESVEEEEDKGLTLSANENSVKLSETDEDFDSSALNTSKAPKKYISTEKLKAGAQEVIPIKQAPVKSNISSTGGQGNFVASSLVSGYIPSTTFRENSDMPSEMPEIDNQPSRSPSKTPPKSPTKKPK